jgi:hypothetical protein
MRPGPHTRAQLAKLRRVWKQGQHVLISGPTGSGKTALARHIVELRALNGGHVVVFCMKPNEDKTIIEDYKEFTRWKRWRKPSSWEKRILLWPDVSKAKGDPALIKAIQRNVFTEAFHSINRTGKWTVQFDEGLYTVSPTFLGMADNLAMSHAMGRSADLTLVTLTQRPSHLPLIIYGSASHAFVGRTREAVDQKRLAELGAKEGSREIARRIADLNLHEFLWVPVAEDWPAEVVDLSR